MTLTYAPKAPDSQLVQLHIVDEGVQITQCTAFTFSGNYLSPCDGWSMSLGGELPPDVRAALRNGARVKLFVDNNPLASGYIDRIDIDADRHRGVTFTVHGRDCLSPVVDSYADPRKQFKTGTTLAEFLKDLLKPYGWSADSQFVIDNAANRDAKTGGLRGIPTRTSDKKRVTKALKDFVLYQVKPHDREGLYRFTSRVAERHGLMIRCSADGEQLIIAGPDFYQEPRYQLRRDRDGRANILGGRVSFDSCDQPSIIVVDGFSGGGEFGRSRIKCYCVNPYFGLDAEGFPLPEVAKVISQYPDAEPILFVTQHFPQRVPEMPFRPMLMHDEESQTQEQLKWFVKRTMSELLRRSLVCHYTVEGFGQYVDDVFTPWDVDTVVDVQDDVAGVNERMYVLGRTFEKSRSAGTVTHLELVRLHSIAVGERPEQKPGFVDNTKLTKEQREDRERPILSTG